MRTALIQPTPLSLLSLVWPWIAAIALACAPTAQNQVAHTVPLSQAADSPTVVHETPSASFAPSLDWQRAPLAYNRELTVQARRELLFKLQALASSEGFALGHQDTTAYGVGWSRDNDRSDVKDVCGSHVAVYGWEIFRLERGAPQNGDGVNFAHLQTLIRNAHELGGINTISWHADNPLTGGDAWDKTPAISAALPSGSGHQTFVAYLDRIADYLDSLRGASGERLPVVLRLFHEQTGDWFWWGRQNSQAEYKALFTFTTRYLKEDRGLDNLLIAFSPDGGRVFSIEDQLYGYPGDEFVDVIGVDYYFDPGQDRLLELTAWLVLAAEARGKVPVLAEFGPRNGINGDGVELDFLSRQVIEPLLRSNSGQRLAYVLAWRNAREDHAFLPYAGHPSASDLKRVCTMPQVFLTEDMNDKASAWATRRAAEH